MKKQDLVYELKALKDYELVAIKNEIIDKHDKRRYAKEVLEELDSEESKKTISWLRERLSP